MVGSKEDTARPWAKLSAGSQVRRSFASLPNLSPKIMGKVGFFPTHLEKIYACVKLHHLQEVGVKMKNIEKRHHPVKHQSISFFQIPLVQMKLIWGKLNQIFNFHGLRRFFVSHLRFFEMLQDGAGWRHASRSRKSGLASFEKMPKLLDYIRSRGFECVS